MNQENEIIIYDGICVLCNFFMRFILKKDTSLNFKATTLQSNYTIKNYPQVTKVDSVALILKNGDILQKSKAVYYILKKVKTLFLIRVLIFILPSQEDADRLLRERQPHLAPQWQKVEKFREMLAREAS